MTQSFPTAPPASVARLVAIMDRLRDPEGGCPWDLDQTFATIAPYTIEEAFEVADAIAEGDMAALKDELGDLLFQVVYHARLAAEQGAFDLEAVAAAICDKMIRRHPHVFATEIIDSGGAVTRRWEDHKHAERTARAAAEGLGAGALDGVAIALPALTRALKLQKRAARVGFDWAQAEDILAKIEEEITELRAELALRRQPQIAEEFGDVLFSLVNLGRRLDIDPESALRGTNAKFERRFRAIEAALAAEGRSPAESDLAEMEALWQRAKQAETPAAHDGTSPWQP